MGAMGALSIASLGQRQLPGTQGRRRTSPEPKRPIEAIAWTPDGDYGPYLFSCPLPIAELEDFLRRE